MKALAIGLIAGTALCGVMSVPASAMPMDNLAAAASDLALGQSARYVCNRYRCRWRPNYAYRPLGYGYGPSYYSYGPAITAMHQATMATDQAGPAACMAAVYTADGGGEARNSLLGTAPLAEARGRASGC